MQILSLMEYQKLDDMQYLNEKQSEQLVDLLENKKYKALMTLEAFIKNPLPILIKGRLFRW